MPLLLLHSLADERAQINAEVREQVYADHARHWTEEIKRIDSTLEIVRAKDNCTDPDLLPGRWYILKPVPDSVDAYIELPRPPGSWMYDWLNAADMWNPRVHRSRREAREKLRAAKLRARQHEAEQRQDEMALAHRAANRIRGDSGMKTRTDLKLPKKIAAERKGARGK